MSPPASLKTPFSITLTMVAKEMCSRTQEQKRTSSPHLFDFQVSDTVSHLHSLAVGVTHVSRLRALASHMSLGCACLLSSAETGY